MIYQVTEYQTYTANGRFAGTAISLEQAADFAGPNGRVIREMTIGEIVWNVDQDGRPVKVKE